MANPHSRRRNAKGRHSIANYHPRRAGLCCGARRRAPSARCPGRRAEAVSRRRRALTRFNGIESDISHTMTARREGALLLLVSDLLAGDERATCGISRKARRPGPALWRAVVRISGSSRLPGCCRDGPREPRGSEILRITAAGKRECAMRPRLACLWSAGRKR